LNQRTLGYGNTPAISSVFLGFPAPGTIVFPGRCFWPVSLHSVPWSSLVLRLVLLDACWMELLNWEQLPWRGTAIARVQKRLVAEHELMERTDDSANYWVTRNHRHAHESGPVPPGRAWCGTRYASRYAVLAPSSKDPTPYAVANVSQAACDPLDMSQQLRRVLLRLQVERKTETLRRGWTEMPPWVFLTATGEPIPPRTIAQELGGQPLRQEREPVAHEWAVW
jgi:hypothetical protein